MAVSSQQNAEVVKDGQSTGKQEELGGSEGASERKLQVGVSCPTFFEWLRQIRPAHEHFEVHGCKHGVETTVEKSFMFTEIRFLGGHFCWQLQEGLYELLTGR